jgi:hypothetical protein
MECREVIFDLSSEILPIDFLLFLDIFCVSLSLSKIILSGSCTSELLLMVGSMAEGL